MLNLLLKGLITRLSVVCLAIFLTGCASPPNIRVPNVPPKPRSIEHQPRVALVLGGGGAKGYAHIGVIKELDKAGVPIDLVVGSSAGALVGSFYADRGRVKDAELPLMNASFWDFIDISYHPWSGGILGGNAWKRFILKNMRASSFKETAIPLVVVTTDLVRGEPYVISSGPISPAVTASLAVPGGIIPLRMYGKVLVDGAMVDPVPVNVAKRYHPKVTVAVNISCELPSKLPVSAFYTYHRAYEISWSQLAKQTQMNADIVIRPSVGQTGTFDLGSRQSMLDEGAKAAKKALPRIKRLLLLRGISLSGPAEKRKAAAQKQG